MLKSKISRSLIVAVFVIFTLFLIYLNIGVIKNGFGVTNSVTSNLIKVGYVIVLILLVLIYMYIKEKLYRMKVQRSSSLIYRYIYITIVNLIASYISMRNILDNASIKFIVFSLIINYFICIFVKKIIFNISKSDMLSVLAMFGAATLPNVILDKTYFINSKLLMLVFFAALFVLQVLIDELKQRGLRTKKYVILSVLLGVLIGFSVLFGINFYVYIILMLFSIFITFNLDNTHINFPKKMMSKLTQEKREDLYKIERININKLYVSIVIIAFFAILVYFGLVNGIKYINSFYNMQIFDSIINLNSNLKIIISNINISSITNFSNMFLSTSTTYYMILFVYIVLIELLSFFLRRRYDTKSTIIKLIFILIFLTLAFTTKAVFIYQPLFAILLVIIVIINTSNLYLNRDERVKMLVA